MVIYEIPNFLSTNECEEIIKRLNEDTTKTPGTIYFNNREIYDSKRKNSENVIVAEENEIWGDVVKYIRSKFFEHVGENIMNTFSEQFRKLGDDPKIIHRIWFGENNVFCADQFITISRTIPNSEYSWHPDIHGGHFTCMIYLNTINPEDGGATEFLSGKKIQPEVGKMLLFPANWSTPHRGMLTKKSKYLVVFPIFLVPKSALTPES